jgi:hypothetical protein
MSFAKRLFGLACLTAIPFSLLADTPKGVMLYVTDSAIVNGAHTSSPSIAVFPDDTVQTQTSKARIGFLGANIALDQDTFVTMGPDFVNLSHGVLLVLDNNNPVAVHAGDVMVMPADTIPTQFEVTHQNGKLRIIAQKGNLLVKDCSGTTVLAEGRQGDRDDSYHCKKGAPPSAKGPIITAKEAEIAGGVAGAGLLIWVTQGGPSTPVPASPVQP